MGDDVHMNTADGSAGKAGDAVRRLFFALWPPSPVVESLVRIARDYAGKFGGRATDKRTIHLTLAFLGDVPASGVPALVEAVHRISLPPFELSIDRLGGWAHNRLMWAGTTQVPDGLSALAEGLRACAQNLGYPLEHRPYTPHITLVRKLPSFSPEAPLPAIEPMRWSCDAFSLIDSRPGDPVARYRSLADFRLQPNDAPDTGGAKSLLR